MKRLLIINIFILSTLSAAFAAPPPVTERSGGVSPQADVLWRV